MRRTLFVTIAIVFLSPVSTLAQRWSANQTEVWSALETCVSHFVNDELEAALACFHPDFSGWLYGEPVPRGKDYALKMDPYFVETRDVRAWELRPIDIWVKGDFAIAHYMGNFVEILPNGTEDIYQVRWTDIMVKENGKWMWISDHGGRVPSGN